MFKNIKEKYILIVLLISFSLQAYSQTIGPWNVTELKQTPSWKTSTVDAVSGMTGLLYESIDYLGNKVEVFAYYSAPAGTPPAGGWPAVVFAHGGGGTAFAQVPQYWNEKGYAAISMDLEGDYPSGAATPNPGPSRVGVWDDYTLPIEEQWYYHAIAQVLVAHSLIASFPEVNASKIGVMGASWGGTITSTVMGVDSRLAWAIPVYGAGFLSQSDGHQGDAIGTTAEANFVNTYYDGSVYFDNVTCPTLWLNGLNDFHFAISCNQLSSREVQGPTSLLFLDNFAHGNLTWRNRDEVYMFADYAVNGGVAPPTVGKPYIISNTGYVTASSTVGISSVQLYYTTDGDNVDLNDKAWVATSASISGNTISASIPSNAEIIFFSMIDSRGFTATSEYLLTSDLSPPVGEIHEIGLIQAEDYNDMSGVKTETTTDVGGGLNVGYIGAGDWFEYEVNVPSSGTYTLDYRLASLNGGGSVQFQVEGITKETTSIASTGDWQNWETLSTSVSLSSGVQTIRLYAAAGGWNINWFELALENGPTGNLALNGIASQSTTAYGGEASYAIDGNTNGSYSGGSVTHTEAITNSWWRVNLGSDYSIDEIKIFNRTNACCTERLSNFTVFVIDAAGNYNFTQTYTTTPNPSLTIDLGGVTGKVVRIRSNLADTALALAEVEVYGSGSSSACPSFSAIEAEDFSSMSGVVDEGANVGYINNGDWAMYSNVDLTCAASIDARTSSKTSGGNIEVRLGSPTGTLIGTVAVAGTGSWTTWATASANLSSVSGTNDVYLVFTGGSGYLFNLDWIEFSENTQSQKIKATKLGVDEISLDEDISDFGIYPNPTSGMLTIKFTAAETADMSIFDITGRTVLSNTISNGSSSIDTSSLPTGLYMIRISTENKTYTKKIIKR